MIFRIVQKSFSKEEGRAVECKQAGVWNTKEKQYFFNRQICNFYSRHILFIKAPNTEVCKINIPGNKTNSSYEGSGEEGMPGFAARPWKREIGEPVQ